ncbi:hypothetical protein SEA_RICKMORE_28 [Gordonia phage Rickmore]|uniref:Uncharacterized protein n=1 Tax=Gordonia phage Rickmore TaxID=2507854 RepID=A0A410TB49_9CAUD|nr:hypothetical protein HWC05_gp28 [Gordonia phage Rickmore]QAU06263.1 hypothetical protein SEA_RICKMORE_28 [Gordonia phage Rickmore]
MIKVGTRKVGEIVDPSRSAKVVLAKHPSGQVREAYPCGTYKTKQLEFNAASDIGHFPLSIMSESNMIGGYVADGVYRPRPTNVEAKQFRLLDQLFDGNEITIEIVPMEMKPLSRPSSVVIGCDFYGKSAIEFVFGSNGSRIQLTNSDNTIGANFPFTHTIAAGNTITIKRLLDIIVVHVNGSYVYAARHPAFDTNDSQVYAGLTTTSSSTEVSTAFGSFKVSGSSYQYAQLIARFDVERRVLAHNAVTLVGSFYVAQGGHVLMTMTEFGWTNWTNFSVRQVEVNVNGQQQILITNQNGGSASKELTLAPNSLIEIKAISNASAAGDRTIKEGLVEIYPY